MVSGAVRIAAAKPCGRVAVTRLVIVSVQLRRIRSWPGERWRLGSWKRSGGRSTRQATRLRPGIAIAATSADPGLERAFDLFCRQRQNRGIELARTSLAGDRFAQCLSGKERNEIQRKVTRNSQMRVSRIPAAFRTIECAGSDLLLSGSRAPDDHGGSVLVGLGLGEIGCFDLWDEVSDILPARSKIEALGECS